MNRTWMIALALLAILSMGGLANGQNAASSQAKDDAGHHHAPKQTKALVHCLTECTLCMGHCAKLVEQGKKEHLTTMQLCAECGDVCFLTLKMASNHSAALAAQMEACVKVCDICGAACEKHPNDEMMKRCAQACRECAKACRDHVSSR